MIFIKSIFYDDGAVSETLGYILLFGIALTAIAIILLVGNSIIDNEKAKDNFQNMVQSFDIIQSDMKQVALDGTPIKTTTIHMDGGALSVNTNTNRLRVDFDATFDYYNATTGQFIFTKQGDTTNNVSVENGGVWKGETGLSSMVSQPRIYITPQTDTMVLNVYRLNNPQTNLADSGTGTMTIKMSYNSNSNVRPTEDVTAYLTLHIDTEYPDAWKQYLNNAVIGTDVSTPTYVDRPNGIDATFTGVKHLVVSEHWIDISLSGLYT